MSVAEYLSSGTTIVMAETSTQMENGIEAAWDL